MEIKENLDDEDDLNLELQADVFKKKGKRGFKSKKSYKKKKKPFHSQINV